MTIRVNGVGREVRQGVTLDELIGLYQLKDRAIVLELNHKVVDRKAYTTSQLKENDTVEIVQFVGGG